MGVDRNTAEVVAESAPPRRISVVDDDASIREALKSLMRSIRFDVDAFASAEEFLASGRFNDTACLILDVYMPGMNGFELQDRLNIDGRGIPIIFITAHADETSRQRALKAGAIDLLGKPVRREALFKAIRSAIKS
jgi:FixJ family two-component response regulator